MIFRKQEVLQLLRDILSPDLTWGPFREFTLSVGQGKECWIPDNKRLHIISESNFTNTASLDQAIISARNFPPCSLTGENKARVMKAAPSQEDGALGLPPGDNLSLAYPQAEELVPREPQGLRGISVSLRIGLGKFSIGSGHISFGPQGLPGGRLKSPYCYGHSVWLLERHVLSRIVL